MGYFNSILAIQAAGFIMMAGAISVAVFKPYKNSLHNTLSLVADSYISTLDYPNISVTQFSLILSSVFLAVAILASFFWNPAARIMIKIYNLCSSSSESRELLSNT